MQQDKELIFTYQHLLTKFQDILIYKTNQRSKKSGSIGKLYSLIPSFKCIKLFFNNFNFLRKITFNLNNFYFNYILIILF